MKATLGLLHVVDEKKLKYTDWMIKRAKHIKDLYGIVHHPSIGDFKSMVHYGFIKNCPITIEDIDSMVNIYGLDVSTLRGKCT